MKAIMISIKPKWCVKIMNGEKTIEVRKNKAIATAIQKLIDEYGYADIYVYCTKDKLGLYDNRNHITCASDSFFLDKLGYDKPPLLNDKVVAKFRCYKVEEFRPFFHWCIEKETCLTRDEVLDYLDSKDKSVGNPKRQDKVYGIHISDLEIFDKPKELSEFKICCSKSILHCVNCKNFNYLFGGSLGYCRSHLTKAPQNFCYVEVEINE